MQTVAEHQHLSGPDHRVLADLVRSVVQMGKPSLGRHLPRVIPGAGLGPAPMLLITRGAAFWSWVLSLHRRGQK